MSEELKPCPFCGGEARVVKADFPAFTPHNNGYFVVCSNCETEIGLKGMESGKTYGSFPRENVAAKAWNTRAERACRMRLVEWNDDSLGIPIKRWKCVCDLCGAEFEPNTHRKYPLPFCAGCGAKVVDE